MILLMLVYMFIRYRSGLKKVNFLSSGESEIEMNETHLVIQSPNATHQYELKELKKVKENKKWYFLYFKDILIPLSKELKLPSELFENSKPTLWKWAVICFLLITFLGGYGVFYNAVKFHGALAWKISEMKTNTAIKLQNDNFYQTKLTGIISSVKAKMKLEPYLMTNDLEIDFKKNGDLTSFDMYVYGFNQNKQLQSGYLIYYDQTKGNRITVHKQNWHGRGTTDFNPKNRLSIVMNMLNSIDVKDEVSQWNKAHYAVLYKGIRNWGYNLQGIRFINKKGEIHIPSSANTEITGPTISLYVPGKEKTITPKRFVYQPGLQF